MRTPKSLRTIISVYNLNLNKQNVLESFEMWSMPCAPAWQGAHGTQASIIKMVTTKLYNMVLIKFKKASSFGESTWCGMLGEYGAS